MKQIQKYKIQPLINSTLGYIKYEFSLQLQSSTLYKDAICSLIGSVMCVIVIFAAFFEYLEVPDAWMMDPLAALLIALILLGEGVKTLRENSALNAVIHQTFV